MSIIKTENICKSFGSVEVLKNVSLTVEPGEVVVIIGPSGAGKSTFLRSLNRLEKTTSGKIWIDDKLVEDRVNGHNQVKMHQKERAAILLEMGMVFQRFNLFPHKTALQNVMLAPMTVKHAPEKDAREKAVKLLEQVGLGDKLDAYPAKLELSAHHIAMVVGDDLNDISQVFSDADVDAVSRVETAIENMEKWGTEWIVLPNAVYGSSITYATGYGITDLFRYFDYTNEATDAWDLYS